MSDASFSYTQADVERFMRYVDKLPSGCWFWTGGRSRGKGNRKWYGSFWVDGRTIRANRFSCEAIGKKGPLPPGYDREHACVFSLCVNPGCIDYTTKEENQALKIQRLAERRAAYPVKAPATLPFAAHEQGACALDGIARLGARFRHKRFRSLTANENDPAEGGAG